jgi:hypothetical protein
MKIKVTQEKATFKPIELTITIESQNELLWYKTLFGLTKGGLVEIDRDFCSLKDPDIDGELVNILERFNGLC